MKKLCLVLVSALLAVALCFSFAACDEQEEQQPATTFSAPANVRVENGELLWNAVEGATNGYTVKINNDESTYISSSKLVLSRVASKLTAGQNTLSVKVNATSEKGASPYSQTVSYAYSVEGGHVHNLTKHNAVEAQCLTSGNLDYWTCDNCDKVFEDENGEEEFEQNAWITQPLGHNLEPIAKLDATCTTEGHRAGQKCSRCNYTEGAETINPLGHNLTKHNAVAAQCLVGGNLDYWTCSGCDKVFKDANGEEEFEQDGWILQPLQHDFTVDVPAVDATCTTAGSTAGKQCVRCDATQGVQVLPAIGHGEWVRRESENTTPDYLVHVRYCEHANCPGEREHCVMSVVDNRAHCDEQGTATHTCTLCNFSYTTTLPAGQHSWDNGVILENNRPTCTKEGVKTFTCTKCRETKTEQVSKIPHDFSGEWVTDGNFHWHDCAYGCGTFDKKVAHSSATDAYVQGETQHYKVCDQCGQNFDVGTHNRNRVLEEVEATCTQTGKTRGEICDVCDKVMLQQTEVAKKAHVLGEHKTEKPATCTENGNAEYWKCGTCNRYFKDSAWQEPYAENEWFKPATGHQMSEEHSAVEPQCEADGNYAYCYCDSCGKYFKDSQGEQEYEENSWLRPATGHSDPLQYHEKVSPQLGVDGTEEYWECDKCHQKFNQSTPSEDAKIDEPATIPALTVATVEKYETYISVNGIYYIFRRYLDGDKQAVKLDGLTVTASKDGVAFVLDDDETLSDGEFRYYYNADNTFIIELKVTVGAEATVITFGIADEDDETEQLYEETDVSASLKLNGSNPYFDGDGTKENRAFNVNGERKGNTNGFEGVFFDLYKATDIDCTSYADTTFTVKGMPVITGIPFDSIPTLDKLKTYLAQHNVIGDDLSFVIVIYGRKTEEDVVNYSPCNSAGVSDVVSFGVTADDAKQRLVQPDTGTTLTGDGGVLAVMPGNWVKDLATLFGVETLSRDDVANYVRFHITVTLNGVSKDFYADISHSGNVEVTAKVMRFNVYKLFQDPQATEYKIAVALALVENSEFADKLHDSLPRELDWKFQVTQDDLRLDIYQGGAWNLGSPDGNIDYKWEVMDDADGLYEGVYIYAFDTSLVPQGSTVQNYDFSSQKPFASYKILSKSYVGWKSKQSDNEPLNDVIKRAWLDYVKALQDGEIAYKFNFVFAMQVVPNEKAQKMGYLPSEMVYAVSDGNRQVKEYSYQESDIKAPNDIQFRFADDPAYLEFLRHNTDKTHNGYAFTEYKAKCVKIVIRDMANGFEYTVYIIPAGTNGTDALYLSKTDDLNDADKKGIDTVSNGYCLITDFNSWINGWFGLSDFDVKDTDSWEIRTQIVLSDESPYLFDGDMSEPLAKN